MFGRPIFTGKRGSLIVDAAICLPFFVIAIAMLLMLIAQTGREESVTRAMVKSAIASVDAAAAAGLPAKFYTRAVANLDRAAMLLGRNVSAKMVFTDLVNHFYVNVQ